MKRFLGSISLILLLIIPLLSEADTIILNSGRKINATKCWEHDDQIKCKIYGQIIGYQKSDIAEIWSDVKPAIIPPKGFRFDIWQSGITVHQAIDIAEANDIPFHRGGLISSNKTFNPKMCRPYVDTATRFGYKERLFNKMATLNFDFTPVSKKLYSLEIVFNGTYQMSITLSGSRQLSCPVFS